MLPFPDLFPMTLSCLEMDLGVSLLQTMLWGLMWTSLCSIAVEERRALVCNVHHRVSLKVVDDDNCKGRGVS